MPKKLSRPAYTLHRPTGQARVRINGRDHYLGPYGSPESRERYDDLIAEWLSRQDTSRLTITVDDLALMYLDHAATYYVKDGQPTSEVDCLRCALRLLIEFAGRTRCRDFGPRNFREFRDWLVGKPDLRGTGRRLSRQYINKTLRRIVRAFKWAAREEIVPVSTWQALTTVEGLRKGRSKAREAPRVKPVEDEHVQAVLPLLPPPVAAMVELQQATGMRPGEVVQMRPCDVTRRTDGVWAYRPPRWKTEHHDEDAERIVFLGPRAQAVLAPWLLRDAETPCFSPREATAWRNEQKRAARKSKVPPSQEDRRKPVTRKAPGDNYTEESYRRAIQYAIAKRNRQRKAKGLPAVPRWAPNQIRHAVGTVVRQQFGLEGAQVALGHSRADVTQVYAERDQAKAAEIARQIG